MPLFVGFQTPAQVMEINSISNTVVKKEVNSSPSSSPRGVSEPLDGDQRPPDAGGGVDLATLSPCDYTARLLQLKREQQVQQQLLLHQYQQQQLQLAEQHEKELQNHIKYLEQQTARAEEERQEKHRQLELDRLQAIKKKSKEEQSAVASSEVKQLLQ
ncbi:histone deacetylase 4-like, partial [Hyalella azteca]|uniref:histone deacetylase n=1 Tax=Hyalella azteca TaxID=294128 RepID=A0A979FVA3_HYAAZ